MNNVRMDRPIGVGLLLCFFPVLIGLEIPGWGGTATASKSDLPHADNGHYQVELTGTGEPWFDPRSGARRRFTFRVTDHSGGDPFPITLDNLTTQIDKINLYGDRLVVFGEESSLHSPVVTLIALSERAELDTFIGLGVQASETGRYLSFRKYYPPQGADPPRVSDLVLVYDLTKGPAENRLRGLEAYRNDHVGRLTEVGRPLYPEINLAKGTYRVWVPEERERHLLLPEGFFWMEDDRYLAFAEKVGDRNYFILADISGGLNNPVVYKKALAGLSPSLGDAIEGLPSSESGILFRVLGVKAAGPGEFRMRVRSAVSEGSEEIHFSLRDLESVYPPLTPAEEQALPKDPE